MNTRHYPKFLRILPETYGLGFHELAYIVFVLICAAILKLNPVTNLVLIFIGIFGIKVMKKYFDFTGWLLPRKKDVFVSGNLGVEDDATF